MDEFRIPIVTTADLAGAQATEQALAGIVQQADKLTASAGQAGVETGRFTDAAGKVREANGRFVELGKSVDETKKHLSEAGHEADHFIESLKQGVTIDIGHRLVESLAEIPAAFNEAQAEGVKFQATMETLRIQLAGAFRSADPGKYLDFAQAREAGEEALEKLRVKANELGTDFHALAETFAINVPVLAHAGIKEVQDQIDAITLLNQVAASKGIGGFQAQRDIIDILIPFNGNQVKTAVADLPSEHAHEITWLFQHGRDNHFDLDALTRKLWRGKLDAFTECALYNVFRGRFNGELSDVVAAIQRYRAVVEARESITRPPFITTSFTKRIFKICDRARFYQRIALLFGDGQTGKTSSLEEYARVNKSRARYLRLPTEAPLRLTIELLGEACYLNVGRPSTMALRAQIVKHFDSQMVLIIDELQQITLTRRSPDRLATVEFFREIFDRSKCGMILCGTNEAMQEVERGPNALWLRQLRRRALPKIMLPKVAADADILTFAAHFGLPAEVPSIAMADSRRVARDDGVGLLITFFQGSARMAAAEAVPVTWEHFRRTVAAFADQGTL